MPGALAPRVVARLAFVPLLLALGGAAGCATTTAGLGVKTPPAGPSREELERNVDVRRTLALEAMHLDGIDDRVRALSSLHVAMGEGLRGAYLRDLAAPRLSPEAHARLAEVRRAARDAYQEDSLRAELAQRFAEREGAVYLGEVRAFLLSSSWKRLSEARAYIRTPTGQKALAAFLAQIASRPPDERRLSRVKELLRASRDVELMSTLSYTATRLALEATLDMLPPELARGYDEWRSSQAESAESFEQSVTRTLLLQDYFALHAVDDKQLEDVLRFWRSDAGRWWAAARVDETRALVEERALQMEEALRLRIAPPSE